MNRLLLLIAALLFAGNTLPYTASADAPFAKVVPGRVLSYPKDHGAHPEFKTEWWYFTGHLSPKGEAKPRFGFELVFFRTGLSPQPVTSPSAWRVSSLYFSHFAITDDQGRRFFAVDQTKRGSLGDAGAANNTLDVWNGNWRAKLDGDVIHLEAVSGEHALALDLKPAKPLVLHGENGFSQKSEGEGNASYYSSFTRLRGSGTLRTPKEHLEIAGASVWMDQEFTSSETAEAKIGWDWFALQLADGSELMLYQLRRPDGQKSPYSAGTIIDAQGRTQKLRNEDFTVEVLRSWKSPESGKTYPAEWKLSVPSLGRTFLVTPTVADQELRTAGSTGVSYWEGRCRVTENGGESGSAYAELVGY